MAASRPGDPAGDAAGRQAPCRRSPARRPRAPRGPRAHPPTPALRRSPLQQRDGRVAGPHRGPPRPRPPPRRAQALQGSSPPARPCRTMTQAPSISVHAPGAGARARTCRRIALRRPGPADGARLVVGRRRLRRERRILGDARHLLAAREAGRPCARRTRRLRPVERPGELPRGPPRIDGEPLLFEDVAGVVLRLDPVRRDARSRRPPRRSPSRWGPARDDAGAARVHADPAEPRRLTSDIGRRVVQNQLTRRSGASASTRDAQLRALDARDAAGGARRRSGGPGGGRPRRRG